MVLFGFSLADGSRTPKGVADACRLALQEVAKVKPELARPPRRDREARRR
jgi:hypothetical protein